MLTIAETRQRTGLVVPVHFPPEVGREQISAILERTFAQHALFCAPENGVAVVDRGAAAEAVLREAGPGSALRGLKVETLERNQGKASAVRAGLTRLLAESSCPYLVTRDCDGDNFLEDLPRLAALAEQIAAERGQDLLAVFGVRPSLMRPMGWMREQWERLVNAALMDLTVHLLAGRNRVLDRRYWNGYPLDLQGGYRLYSRAAARVAADSLADLPDDSEVYLLACEALPFPALSLAGGVIGQVQVSTRFEQPVSSYRGLPFALCYGALLEYAARRHGVPPHLMLAMLDNHLTEAPAYFSSARDELMECRQRILPGAPAPPSPAIL